MYFATFEKHEVTPNNSTLYDVLTKSLYCRSSVVLISRYMQTLLMAKPCRGTINFIYNTSDEEQRGSSHLSTYNDSA
jgi:hypothetical protein